MKLKARSNILGIYDLLLAAAAIYTGLLMIKSKIGIFSVYPNEWLNKLPVHNWIIPGIIAIFIFGLGNMIASISCFLYENGRTWSISVILGIFLLLVIIAQIIVFDEFYLVTLQIMILSLFQVALSFHVYLFMRKSRNYVTASREDELL